MYVELQTFNGGIRDKITSAGAGFVHFDLRDAGCGIVFKLTAG